MKIPEFENTIESLIYQAYESDQELPRPHMGASQLGHACDRWLWLSFRHAVIEKFNGRMLLLFKRGHDEEIKIVNNLRRINAHVTNIGSSQVNFDFGSHVKGSADGIVTGLPIAPKTKAILECKTHSDKSFKELKAKGVKVSKPLHWIQCCVYGYGAKLDRALYVAVNKNTDEIYTEWLHLDKEVAEKAVARGQRLTLTDRLPPPISTDPTWFECKMCAGHDFCHGSKTTKEVNCRTCAHITPLSDSTWHCAKWDAIVPTEAQYEGCEAHVLHPDLVPWKRLESPSEWVAVYEIDGLGLANGEPGEGVYGSKELLANAAACSDPAVNKIRAEFDARVVG